MTSKIPRHVPLTCEEESLLSNHSRLDARFACFHRLASEVSVNEDCSQRAFAAGACGGNDIRVGRGKEHFL
jgi:hypothetical protein